MLTIWIFSGESLAREEVDEEKGEWFYFCESPLDYGEPSIATL